MEPMQPENTQHQPHHDSGQHHGQAHHQQHQFIHDSAAPQPTTQPAQPVESWQVSAPATAWQPPKPSPDFQPPASTPPKQAWQPAAPEAPLAQAAPAQAWQPTVAPVAPSPVPSAAGTLPNYARTDQPTAVVKVLSVRGLEYLMMSLALWVGSFALAGILLSLINSGTSFDVLSFPVSSLVVATGLFTLFFRRLKKAELWDPNLRFDPSKRRLSQLTQVVAYIAVFISLIGIVYSTLAKLSSDLSQTYWKLLLDFVVVIAVAGGVLAYYWIDEHKV